MPKHHAGDQFMFQRAMQDMESETFSGPAYVSTILEAENAAGAPMKPWPEIFHFALSATQSEVRDSLMIGDSWENDVAGAKGVGMHQVFYNVTGKEELPFQPTYHISNLKELMQIL